MTYHIHDVFQTTKNLIIKTIKQELWPLQGQFDELDDIMDDFEQRVREAGPKKPNHEYLSPSDVIYSGGILPDHELRAWAETHVTPYDPELINPASIDLRLGDTVRIPPYMWRTFTDDITPSDLTKFPRWSDPFTFSSYWLYPNDFVLCHSLEHTTLELDQIGLLYLKSSLGRIGLEHLHAGFGDPGFSGQWTFELKNVAPWPIELVAGQRLMQLVVMRMSSPPERGYGETGRYQGQMGPTEAR